MEVKQNILGQEYTILSQTEEENPKLVGADGIAELYSKKLVIDLTTFKDSWENIEEYQKQVIRHEIIHAIFHEAGLTKYRGDEDLVDFLAVQFPKIEKLLNDHNITDILNGLKA